MVNHDLFIEGANIPRALRNFSGKGRRYNPIGHRNFCVRFEPNDPVVQELINDGWNIKYLQPRDGFADDQPAPILQVAVSFDNYPPKIVLINSDGKTVLDEDSLSFLDWAEIENADLRIKPYNWNVNGNSGVRAYLKSAYITIVEDEFEKKYQSVPYTSQIGNEQS